MGASRVVQVERFVAAAPQRVWDLVAEVTHMGEWSPETTSAGQRFAFDVKAGPFKVARWAYEFVPIDGGCRVNRNQETMTETLERLANAAARA